MQRGGAKAHSRELDAALTAHALRHIEVEPILFSALQRGQESEARLAVRLESVCIHGAIASCQREEDPLPACCRRLNTRPPCPPHGLLEQDSACAQESPRNGRWNSGIWIALRRAKAGKRTWSRISFRKTRSFRDELFGVYRAPWLFGKSFHKTFRRKFLSGRCH